MWWDWLVVAGLLTTAIGETIFRTDVPARPLATVVALLVIPVLLWRRTHPLGATAVGFGGAMVLSVPMLFGGSADVGLNSMVGVLLLPYALYRWASGREALIGTAITAVPATLSLATTETPFSEVMGGFAVLIVSFAMGAAMRYRAVARRREVQQVRASERSELARELHDTVAHHVSAIAIQAQAGRAVAAGNPAAALEALAVIEAEASRTLYEMRTMVRVLRHGEFGGPGDGTGDGAVEYAPQRGIGDLGELSRMSPLVQVSVQKELVEEPGGDFAGLPQPVEVAVYRICQESVTNAIRHSLNATRVSVAVSMGVEDGVDVVRLRVHDDGEVVRPAAGVGYGLLGMEERAKMLGGSCQAGPDPAGGWTVAATLPQKMAQQLPRETTR